MPSHTPVSVHDLVEQRVQQWMAEQRRRSNERPATEPPRAVITISRQAGTDGTELARAVAEALGFQLWDQELVQRVAEQTGAPEVLLRAVDERARSAIQELLAGILMGDAATEGEYFAQLMRVFHALAHHGAAVIVGRGAQFVFAPERALRVRVVAPLEVRLRKLASSRKLSDAAAHSELEKIDRERLHFVRNHYHRDASDPSAYDLVVNVGSMSPRVAVEVIVAAYRAKFPRA
jgi:cytidylate kinase